MNAAEFNALYPPETVFTLVAHPAQRGGRVVSTVSVARDFKCGSIVEINVEPYFVHIDKLKNGVTVKEA
ncbi:hypothetical protein EXW94_24025 [Enterobacter sp. JMULE2]|uniref:hypothetical protein n=1 Tax=Enterobacter sp. JMULE2 TaxID=2518340 RepID=UPI001575012D|nr:hypothetical protein [Enterobacter sp. JMULE2]NTZ40686.1 hypothetical protein [Enterobacter sp. JMULE2]